MGSGSQTDVRAKPARPEAGTASGALVRRLDPNLTLAAAAVCVVALEAAYRTWVSDAWLLAQALVAALALLQAWLARERLRLFAVAALALALPLALLAVHLGLDVRGDKDSSVVFRWQGNMLRRGDYPRSEYPIGAVLLFALEAWLGGGATRTANAVLMAPLHALTVGAVWLTRMPYASWLAAVVALWPANAFYWQYKFDLAPAALLAVGLLLAWRGRWVLSGVALGAGTLVKWTPLLAALALVAWLVGSRRPRLALSHAVAFAVTVALVYVPAVLASDDVLAAYERQSGRAITPESVWYLLLRPFGLAHVRTHISFSAGAPGWADALATVLQIAAVLAIVGAAALARTPRGAIALAALAPAAFLLTNRIFSPQFMLVLFAAWAFAGSLLVRTAREQLAVGVAMCATALGNEFVYPFALPRYDVTWVLCSSVLFAVGLGLTGWLVLRAAAE
jgi:glycosyl transferase family 87